MSSIFSFIPTSRSTLQEINDEVSSFQGNKNKTTETVTQVSLTYSSNDSFNQDTKPMLTTEADRVLGANSGFLAEFDRFAKKCTDIEKRFAKSSIATIDIKKIIPKEQKENTQDTLQHVMKLEIIVNKLNEQLNKAEQTVDLRNKELFSLKELNKKKELEAQAKTQEIEIWKERYLQLEKVKNKFVLEIYLILGK